MKIDLSDKTAIVTGSTSGVGLAIARELAGTGARVVVNGRSEAGVDAAVMSITKDSPQSKVCGIAADVSTAAGCAKLVDVVPSADILINNSGIFEQSDFFDITDEDWTRFFETNVMSGVRLSRAYMKGMLQRNWGRIVFISSEPAQNLQTGLLRHGTAKAQLAISQGLAELAKGTAVTVDSVAPGPTSPESVGSLVKELAKQNSQPGAVTLFVKRSRSMSLIQRYPVV